MDLKRILTTVLGIPLVIIIFLLGNKLVIGLLILIVSIICMSEYFGAVKKVSKPIEWVGYLSNIFIVGAMFLSKEIWMQAVIYTIPFIVLLLFLQVIITDMKTTFKDVAYSDFFCCSKKLAIIGYVKSPCALYFVFIFFMSCFSFIIHSLFFI